MGLSSTSSSTTPKPTSVSETTAKTTEITVPTNSVKTTSKTPADRIEVLPVVNLTNVESDLEELESKVEASGDEDSEASGTEAPLGDIPRGFFTFFFTKIQQTKTAVTKI